MKKLSFLFFFPLICNLYSSIEDPLKFGPSKFGSSRINKKSDFSSLHRNFSNIDKLERKVQLNPDTQEKIAELKKEILNSQLMLDKYGTLPLRTVLFFGPRGTGKTSAILELTKEIDGFVLKTPPGMLSQKFGFADSGIEETFKFAVQVAEEKKKPCILWLEHLDMITPSSKKSNMPEDNALKIIEEIKNLKKSSAQVFVIAETSKYENLSSDIASQNTFDSKILFDLPNEETRKNIIDSIFDEKKIISNNSNLISQDIDTSKIARESAGFSGQDLKHLLDSSFRKIFHDEQTILSQEPVEECVAKMLKENSLYNIKKHENGQGFGKEAEENKFSIPAKYISPNNVDCDFTKIALDENIKQEVTDILEFLKSPEKFKKVGARIPRGILLYGPPGTGKTLLAKALAGESNCSFLSVSGPDLTSKFLGDSTKNIATLFEIARAKKIESGRPTIIFVDEIDSFARKRGSSYGALHDDNVQMLEKLFTELDGFSTQDGSVIVVGATNKYELIDEALLRPGRLERQVCIENPYKEIRLKILECHAKKHPIDYTQVNLENLAQLTIGKSGADLANILNEAAIFSAKEGLSLIGQKQINLALDKMNLGISLDKKMSKNDQIETAYHEAGHALATMLRNNQKKVLDKITILPRGRALGVSFSKYLDDISSMTEQDLADEIVIALAGMVAEKQTFNQHSSGVSNDLEKASKIAEEMVCKYGMRNGEIIFARKNNDGKLSAKAEKVIEETMQEYLKECENLIFENKDKLEALAQKLLEKETITAKEAYQTVGLKYPSAESAS